MESARDMMELPLVDLTVTVAMYERMGLETNLNKNKTMVYNPVFVWGEW